MMYYTYILRCEDGSVYTGIAADLERRVKEHFARDARCAKYTLTHPAKMLECAWQSADRSTASRLEYQIKALPKAQKEELILKNNLAALLDGKIDCNKYKRIDSAKIRGCRG